MTVDGIRFASQKEARRYKELKLLERQEKIFDLELQPRFNYLSQDGLRIIFFYKADFSYRERGKEEKTIEDTKGYKTPLYKVKKRLIEDRFNIKILET